jgi:hypothetical protein
MMRRRLFAVLVLAGAVLTGVIGVSTAAATTYPTLDGEIMTGIPQVTSNCNLFGTSTISYSVSGFATGTYPGPFTETGIATIGAQPIPGQPVPITSFSATFVIDSGLFRVTGIKTLSNSTVYATNLGFCLDFLKSFGAEATYDARVSTPTGTYADYGRTNVAVNDRAGVTDFFEQLHSSLFELQPVIEPIGKVTGGGAIGNSEARTGFVVERKDSGSLPKGQWEYLNKSTGDIVHSTAISDLGISGNVAVFSGTCRNEALPPGTPCTFTVTVQDNGNGASGVPDMITVSGAGFTGASGSLSGNLVIH